MRTALHLSGALALVLAIAACGDDAGGTSGPGPGPGVEPVGNTPGPGTETGLAQPVHRPRRRMDLDQLEASVLRVTGGIGWTTRSGGRDVSQLAVLAPTLGKPDYIQITEEDLEPSALFQKFLDDMARDVCTKLTNAEETRAAADRTLLVGVEPADTVASAGPAIDAALRAALLRYHGRAVAEGSAEITPWQTLFTTASTAVDPDDPMQGWRAVCVGLMTHPNFYSY